MIVCSCCFVLFVLYVCLGFFVPSLFLLCPFKQPFVMVGRRWKDFLSVLKSLHSWIMKAELTDLFGEEGEGGGARIPEDQSADENDTRITEGI